MVGYLEKPGKSINSSSDRIQQNRTWNWHADPNSLHPHRQQTGGAYEGSETPFTTATNTLRKKKSYIHNVKEEHF